MPLKVFPAKLIALPSFPPQAVIINAQGTIIHVAKTKLNNFFLILTSYKLYDCNVCNACQPNTPNTTIKAITTAIDKVIPKIPTAKSYLCAVPFAS